MVVLPSISLTINDRWLPKSVLCLRHYNLNKFARDVIAGITVGLVALPLAMAFAIDASLRCESGAYSKCHRQRQRHQSDGDSCNHVARELVQVVMPEAQNRLWQPAVIDG